MRKSFAVKTPQHIFITSLDLSKMYCTAEKEDDLLNTKQYMIMIYLILDI